MCPTWASRQEVVLGEAPSASNPSMKELNLVTSLDTCLHLKAIKRTCFDSLLNTNIATSFSPLLDHLHRLIILLPFLGIMRSKPSSAMRLLLCSSVVLTASAGVIRAPPTLEDCQLEIQDKMANDPNRVNTAGTAGIGAEFETPEIYLETTSAQRIQMQQSTRSLPVERARTGSLLRILSAKRGNLMLNTSSMVIMSKSAAQMTLPMAQRSRQLWPRTL